MKAGRARAKRKKRAREKSATGVAASDDFQRVCPSKAKSDGQEGKNSDSSIGPKATLFNAQISSHYLEVFAACGGN